MEKLMSLQTAAAFSKSSPTRQSRPLAHANSTSSNSSSSSTSPDREGGSAKSSIDFVRCSRCQRTASLSSSNPMDGMVSIGLNSYYCTRCASMVGFSKHG